MENFCIGRSVVTENARYVQTRFSEIVYKEFHSEIIDLEEPIIINGREIKILTNNCNNMDIYGFCMGHFISREGFIRKYCNGIEPNEEKDT